MTKGRHAAHGRGFTLIEMIVSIAILTLVLMALLMLFDVNNRMARIQTQVADMQQSGRIAQHDLVRSVRMAGRGGLPKGTLPQGLALSLQSNVGAGTVIGAPGTPPVLQDTDVLTVRGVINSPMYQANPVGGGFALNDSANPSSGTIRIQDPSPQTGAPQNLAPLEKVISTGTAVAEALILVSPLDDSIYAVVELNPLTSNVNDTDGSGRPIDITLGFTITGGSGNAADFINMSPGNAFPPNLRAVAFLGILEEYRYYIRADAPGGPRLTEARFFPNTNVPYRNQASNLDVALADDIIDFQVALGIDTDGSEEIEDADWLFDGPGDNPADSHWNTVPGPPPAPAQLFYVRVTTLAQTRDPDRQYVAPPIQNLEDRPYNETDNPASPAELLRRRVRRRILQSVVDTRNV